jgi:hypothetical protein
MIVKDLIVDAMRLVGRVDAAEIMSTDDKDEEVTRLEYTMLYCFNAVMDELARGYFPVKTTQAMTSQIGQFAFADFEHKPIKVVRVLCDGRKTDWRLFPEFIKTRETSVTIEYEYVPDKAAEDDEFYYPDASVGERLVTFGMAAEYLLICGEVESANCWEARYRTEIDRLLSLRTVKERIMPRRWL